MSLRFPDTRPTFVRQWQRLTSCLNAIMYFIELEVNQGSETLISTDRGLAPRLERTRVVTSQMPV
jgi:hypothetical protein